MRILLCDDDNMTTPGAIDRISQHSIEDGGGEVVIARHARSARLAFSSIASTRFDLVLIDLLLPIKHATAKPAPPSGPWLARAIGHAYPGLAAPLVMWTANAASTLEARNQCRAFRHHGGHQIIDKVDPPNHQLQALEAALEGNTWEPPDDGLTPVERNVIAYFAEGFSDQEIAVSLNYSKVYIEAIKRVIRQKLLPVPAPPETGRGFGPVLAVASAPGSRISWVPVQHLSEPPGIFAEIDKG